MRRLHPVARQEQVIAQGEYLCLRDGAPMGVAERWELARLQDDSRVLRAEIGDRAGLWHLMLAPDGRPDRLQARLHDGAGRRFDATFTFFDDEVMVAGGQMGKRPVTEFVELPPDWRLMWPPVAGRELALTGTEPGRPASLYWLEHRPPEDGWLTGRLVRCTVEQRGRSMCQVPAGAFEVDEWVLMLHDTDGQRAWIDGHGTVVQWQADSHNQVVLSRYWRFDHV